MRGVETSLQEYGEFLLRARLVSHKAAPFCVRWVRRFLNRPASDEPPADQVRHFVEHEGRSQEWQVRQAEHALQIYFVNFLGRSDWQQPRPSAAPDEHDRTDPLALLEAMRHRLCRQRGWGRTIRVPSTRPHSCYRLDPAHPEDRDLCLLETQSVHLCLPKSRSARQSAFPTGDLNAVHAVSCCARSTDADSYGLEKTTDVTALVMELLEGEDLSQRIARGPIAIDEAVPFAKQIVAALEAAHERGIIHRDLKPANIKVRAAGTVEVLDVGLAKAMDRGSKDPGLHGTWRTM